MTTFAQVVTKDMNLPDYQPFVLRVDDLENTLPVYLPLIDAVLDSYRKKKEENSKTEFTANAVNNILYVGNMLNTGVKMGSFVAQALGAGVAATTAVANVATVVGTALSPAASLVNAIVMGYRTVQASGTVMTLTRLKSSHYDCTCRKLGTECYDPVTGHQRGAKYLYGNLVTSSSPACESLRQYAMSQLGKRADRSLMYASPIGTFETIRRMGKSIKKKVQGTKGKTRRFAAINLWGSARAADTKNELYATIWDDEPLKGKLNGKDLTLKEGEVCVLRMRTAQGWNDILTKGCPMAIGVIHCLLGGNPSTFSAKEWQKTMVTIASVDGWRVIEDALKST